MAKDFKLTIKPHEETYSPGSVIAGTLSFDLEEAKKYDYVQVSLYGASYVRWTRGSGDSRETRKSTEDYVKEEKTVWKGEESPSGTIGPGHYEYDFEFALPSTCPSSLETREGNIRYAVRGKIGKGSKVERHAEVEIKVIEKVDVSQLSLQEPARRTQHRDIGFLCCAAGGIDIEVEVPQTGYCITAEDTIPISVTVENGSTRIITRIDASLFQDFRYHAEGRQIGHSNAISNVRSESIQANTTTSFQLPELAIPTKAIPTISSSSNIKVTYALIVIAIVPNSVNQKIVIPITLGNERSVV